MLVADFLKLVLILLVLRLLHYFVLHQGDYCLHLHYLYFDLREVVEVGLGVNSVDDLKGDYFLGHYYYHYHHYYRYHLVISLVSYFSLFNT